NAADHTPGVIVGIAPPDLRPPADLQGEVEQAVLEVLDPREVGQPAPVGNGDSHDLVPGLALRTRNVNPTAPAGLRCRSWPARRPAAGGRRSPGAPAPGRAAPPSPAARGPRPAASRRAAPAAPGPAGRRCRPGAPSPPPAGPTGSPSGSTRPAGRPPPPDS